MASARRELDVGSGVSGISRFLPAPGSRSPKYDKLVGIQTPGMIDRHRSTQSNADI